MQGKYIYFFPLGLLWELYEITCKETFYHLLFASFKIVLLMCHVKSDYELKYIIFYPNTNVFLKWLRDLCMGGGSVAYSGDLPHVTHDSSSLLPLCQAIKQTETPNYSFPVVDWGNICQWQF